MLEKDIYDPEQEDIILPKTEGRTRAERRYYSIRKALRKQRIAKAIYHTQNDNTEWEYYPNLHQYSKNKIHCSCPICTEKTNPKNSKSKGAVSYRDTIKKNGEPDRIVHGSRIPTTNKRYGKKHWRIADLRKIEKLNSQQECLDEEV